MSYQRTFLNRMHQACIIANWKGAKVNEAVVTAQAAVESGWGRSQLATEYNNILGIKAGSYEGPTVSLPTWEWGPNGWYRTVAWWRVYASWNENILDYYYMIRDRWWFEDALNHVDDADRFLRCLMPSPGKPGYATSPDYFELVRNVGRTVERLGGPKWSKQSGSSP